MAKQRSRKPVRRRDRKGGPSSGRRKPCPYCKDKIEHVDYKDVDGLRRFISEKGKIRSRRITGACRRHQNQVSVAVKRAREMALLPYVGDRTVGGGLATLGGLDRALGGRLGELARDQVVAQVALGDLDDGPLGPQVVDVLEQDGLGHG